MPAQGTVPVLIALGEKDRAIEQLQWAFEEHDQLIPYLKVWSLFDPLRPDPRFQDLQRRMNFPPQGRPRLLASPFLAFASDSIPFRIYAVAESTGIHDNTGEQPFPPPLPDCACETPFPGNDHFVRAPSREVGTHRLQGTEEAFTIHLQPVSRLLVSLHRPTPSFKIRNPGLH